MCLVINSFLFSSDILNFVFYFSKQSKPRSYLVVSPAESQGPWAVSPVVLLTLSLRGLVSTGCQPLGQGAAGFPCSVCVVRKEAALRDEGRVSEGHPLSQSRVGRGPRVSSDFALFPSPQGLRLGVERWGPLGHLYTWGSQFYGIT